MTASRDRTRDRVRRIASSTAWSASVTGVRSGLLITCRSSALKRAVGERVGVVGEHVGEAQVVGVVGRATWGRHGHRLFPADPCAVTRVIRMEINGLPLHPLVVHVVGRLRAAGGARRRSPTSSLPALALAAALAAGRGWP